MVEGAGESEGLLPSIQLGANGRVHVTPLSESRRDQGRPSTARYGDPPMGTVPWPRDAAQKHAGVSVARDVQQRCQEHAGDKEKSLHKWSWEHPISTVQRVTMDSPSHQVNLTQSGPRPQYENQEPRNLRRKSAGQYLDLVFHG